MKPQQKTVKHKHDRTFAAMSAKVRLLFFKHLRQKGMAETLCAMLSALCYFTNIIFSVRT